MNRPLIFFSENPAAGDVTVQTLPEYGPAANNVVAIATPTGTIYVPPTASYCVQRCTQECTSQSFTVTFNNIDFGDCNECGKEVMLTFYLRKDTIQNIGNFDDDRSVLQYSYQGRMRGTVTGADLAADFQAFIENARNQGGHDFWGGTITVVSNVVTIVFPCPNKMRNVVANDNNTLDTGELPVVVKITDGFEPFLTKLQLLGRFPMNGVQPIPGGVPPASFTWCHDVCTVTIKGCWAACPTTEFLNSFDGTTLTSASVPINVELILNNSAAGYAGFIAALNSNITGCTLSTTPAPGQPLYTVDGTTGEVTTGRLDLTPSGGQLVAGSIWAVQTSAGLIAGPTLPLAAGTIAALVSALQAAYPSGTFAVQGAAVRLTGTIAGADGTAINLSRYA